MLRTLTLAGVLGLCAMLAVVAAGGPGPPGAARPSRSLPVEAGSAQPPRAEVEPTRSAPGTPADAPPRRAAEPAAPAPADTGTRGTVVVRDLLGGFHALESGVATLRIDTPDGPRARRVQVVDGAFRLPDVVDGRVDALDLRLGGRAARLERALQLSSGELELHALWLAWGRLRVVDATGRDLDAVALVRTDARATHAPNTHAGSPHALRPSPIALGEGSARDPGLVRYWARAEGFAWSDTLVDPAAGGDHTVQLVPGATLHLLHPGAPPSGTRIEVVDRRGTRWRPVLDGSGRATLDGVALGPGRVEIHDAGGCAERPETLEFTVDASGATVGLATLESATTVRLAGTLRVPPSWDGFEPTLVLHPVEGPRPLVLLRSSDMKRDGELFVWDAGEQRSGRWTASLPQAGYETTLDACADLPSLHRIELPEPARLALSVRLAGSGAAPPDAEVRWRAAGSRHRAVPAVRLPGTDGCFELRTAAGAIELYASRRSDSRSRTRVDLTLPAGPSEASIELLSQAEIVVRLREGSLDRAWDAASQRLTVRNSGGEPERTSRTNAVRMERGGSFEISLELGPAFEPVDPLRVECAGGQRIELEVQVRSTRL